MIRIDKITKDDLPGLKYLYEDAFGSITDLDKMASLFDEIKDNANQIILVAKEDNKILGSVLGVICYELIGDCSPFMVLEDVAVLKSHRRLGIAKNLLLEMELQAKQKNCNMILFVSSSHREGAHKLYDSLGYGADKVNGYRKRLIGN